MSTIKPWHVQLTEAAARDESIPGVTVRPVRDVVTLPPGTFRFATGEPLTRPIAQLFDTKYYDVVAGWGRPDESLVGTLGRVNDGPFCGFLPGTLRLAGTRGGVDEPIVYSFAWRPFGWNLFVDPQTGQPRALADRAGQPPYQAVDFAEIP